MHPRAGAPLSYRLVVDPVACDGRGICAELLPELVTLDDWGFPMVADVTLGPRGEPLLETAREAARICPRLALRLEPRPAPDHGSREAGHDRPASGHDRRDTP